MGFQINMLWSAPEVNPYNKKARSIPILNPINNYGRVFFFSWMGFFIAFWSWYAFPPLLSHSIKGDMHLSPNEIANSNIIALTATLLCRFIAGPMCDYFGPRKTFATMLFAGALPSALAGTAHNATGLYFIRFFVGILGGTFVPCQVWTTGFFDRNIVGTANSLVGGWGNSGGGITYFVMPAIYDSLRNKQHLSNHVAWRVSFIVPFILITFVASCLLLLTDDTPTGKWADRACAVPTSSRPTVVPASGTIIDKPTATESLSSHDEKKKRSTTPPADVEAGTGTVQIINEAQHEVVVKPSTKEFLKILTSIQTITLCAAYFCSFGGELAINSILGTYYLKNVKHLGQTTSGRWAAMFGLLNIITRPLGGFISDIMYKANGRSLWTKKAWIHVLGVITGILLIIIGQKDPHRLDEMIGLIAFMAIFLEAGNGANFSLVPHVHPWGNGILSGLVGASGNLGGIVFAIIFRCNKTDYRKVFWIMGIVHICLNIAFVWVRPRPKGQIGGN